MRKTTTILLLSISILGIFLTALSTNKLVQASPQTSTLIPIEKTQLTDENIRQIANGRTAEVLVDNQSLLPSSPIAPPQTALDSISKTTWQPSFGESNVATFIDLKTTYTITHIAFYDTSNSIDLKFSVGEPFSWTNVLDLKTDQYNAWRINEITPTKTQFLRIETLSGIESGISEIALYGYQTGADPAPIATNNTNPNFNLPVGKAIGSNAFIDDPLTLLASSGLVREYHNFSWTLDSPNQNKFNPSYGGKWDFDTYYKNLKAAGIEAFACIQGISRTVMSTTSAEHKPIAQGANPTDPQSYKTHASTMFQYAARYGNTKVADHKLLLAPDQARLSGLNYLKYYENWNEPDKTWEGNEGYFSPYALAAMTSADYDGHERTLGDTYGIKNADPSSQLVMAGLASNGETAAKYLNLMNLWFKYNRQDQKLALDVINFHAYTGKLSPEAGNLRAALQPIVQWRNQNARDKEVWLTEFGWDSTTSSPNAAGSNATQRDWLIRGNLIALASGVDRVTMYMSRDASWVGDPTKYATSGLTTMKNDWKKKDSWFGLYTMQNTLKDFVFDRIVTETANLYIYQFKNPQTGETAFALWSPTSDGSTIKNYQFNVGGHTKATLTQLQTGYYDGLKTRLPITNQTVSVDISETPIFITLANQNGQYPAPTNAKISLSPDMVSVKSLETPDSTTKFQQMAKQAFDEQAKVVAGPTMDSATTFDTELNSDSLRNAPYPLEIYLDLQAAYHISHTGIYDTNSTGIIKFYAGEPNNWDSEPFATNHLSTYNTWVVTPSTKTTRTRYIKIVKENSAKLKEIAFYGYSLATAALDPNSHLNQPPSTPTTESTAQKPPSNSAAASEAVVEDGSVGPAAETRESALSDSIAPTSSSRPQSTNSPEPQFLSGSAVEPTEPMAELPADPRPTLIAAILTTAATAILAILTIMFLQSKV